MVYIIEDENGKVTNVTFDLEKAARLTANARTERTLREVTTNNFWLVYHSRPDVIALYKKEWERVKGLC